MEAKVIEEHFTREGVLLNVHVGGEVIQTTPEHPFYVRDKGWTPAEKKLPVVSALLPAYA